MASIARSRVQITYDKGGPGVTTWYWSGGFPNGGNLPAALEDMHTEIAAVYTALKPYIPSNVTCWVRPEVDIVDASTGLITGVLVSDQKGLQVQGTNNSSQVSRGTQVCVNLYTDRWINGRRLKGRHFIGPIGGGVVGNDGQISPATQATFEDAYASVISGVGGRLAILHRGNSNTHTGFDYGDVVSVKTMDRPANLSSRRDA